MVREVEVKLEHKQTQTHKQKTAVVGGAILNTNGIGQPSIETKLEATSKSVLGEELEKTVTSDDISELPALDSPDFWAIVEGNNGDGSSFHLNSNVQRQVTLEWLAQAVREFTKLGEMDKAKRVFTTIYMLFEKRAITLATKYVYSPHNQFGGKSSELIEELAQEVWLKVFRDLTEPVLNTLYLTAFATKFEFDVKSTARQLGIEEGYYGKSRVPSNAKVSFDAPLNSNDTSDEENLTLSNIIPSEWATYSFWSIEVLDAIKTQLNFQEREIIRLLANGYSKNYIAKTLHIAEKTLNRHIDEIKPKISDILSIYT